MAVNGWAEGFHGSHDLYLAVLLKFVVTCAATYDSTCLNCTPKLGMLRPFFS